MTGWLLKIFTGNPLSMLWVIGGVAAFALVVGAVGPWKVQGWRLEAVQAKYDSFVAQTKTLGDAAKKEAARHEAEDKANKEKTDADHKNAVDKLNATIRRLRNARPGSSFVPAAPTNSARPDLACYDRAEFVGAIGRLIDGVRGLADEGSKATLDLNAAKEWAVKLRMDTFLLSNE